MRRKHIIGLVVAMFLSWNMIMYVTLVNRFSVTPVHKQGEIGIKLNNLHVVIQEQIDDNERILNDLRELRTESELKEALTQLPYKIVTPNGTGVSNDSAVILPVLIIACDRSDAVTRSLDLVLKYRTDARRFPVIVSQDCGHQGTADTIQKYVTERGIMHIKQPDLSAIDIPWPQKKFEGYYKISRHYKWALNQVFHTFNYSAVIIVEDDLDISPDFYEYFGATYRILSVDKSLWCVSAWNDNGKKGMVKEDPELLHRTDFFPGLGWMLERNIWLELGPKWPTTFWDDWMRHPDQRQGRSCIRPELSRTSTFGKVGVSKGLFFDKHLKFIKLNENFVPFTKKDLSYLIKENYDPVFLSAIYNTSEISLMDVKMRTRSDLSDVRVTYKTMDDFKNIAKELGIMDDFKAGVERTAYLGVVSVSYNGQRVHVAPTQGWSGYDPSWS